MSAVGAYAVHWRSVIFLVGGALLVLSALTGSDFGVFPFVFFIISALAYNGRNRKVGGAVAATVARRSDMDAAPKRAACFVSTFASICFLVAGLVGLGWALLQRAGEPDPLALLNTSLLLILASALFMFALESTAIRHSWFPSVSRSK